MKKFPVNSKVFAATKIIGLRARVDGPRALFVVPAGTPGLVTGIGSQSGTRNVEFDGYDMPVAADIDELEAPTVLDIMLDKALS